MSSSNTKTSSAISEQARDWVLRLASGEMDGAEMARLKAWLAASDAHKRAFEQRRSLWLQLGNHPELFAQTVPPIRRPRNAWGRMPRPRKVAIGASAIAASLLAILIAPEAALWFEADHRTTTSVAEYALPDGSTAWLDAGSAISVDFNGRERKVTLLRGNAWFDVRHGVEPPFRVAALSGVTQDIGTSFEVRRWDSRVDVAVSQGAVRVASGAERSEGVVLREGEGIAYDASGRLLRQSSPAPASIAAWRRKELIIDRQPLAEAIREIGRYRSGPTWVWADLSDRASVNAAFRIDDADTALRDLAAVEGLAVTWLPGDIAIIRHGNPTR